MGKDVLKPARWLLLLFITSCSSGTQLGGVSGQKNASNAQVSETSSAADDETLGGGGVKKAVIDRHAPVTSETADPVEGADGNLDEDLKVIPPEVVTGAFLACVDADANDVHEQDSGLVTRIGCSILDQNENRIDLTDAVVRFELTTLTGDPVRAEEILRPSSAEFDVILVLDHPVSLEDVSVRAELNEGEDVLVIEPPIELAVVTE